MKDCGLAFKGLHEGLWTGISGTSWRIVDWHLRDFMKDCRLAVRDFMKDCGLASQGLHEGLWTGI